MRIETMLAWLTVGIDWLGLRIGKWIPNLGATIKLIIFAVLIIGGFRYGAMNGSANVINVESLTPHWEDGLKFLPVIIYGMLGFELVSAAGDEIRNPRRNVRGRSSRQALWSWHCISSRPPAYWWHCQLMNSISSKGWLILWLYFSKGFLEVPG